MASTFTFTFLLRASGRSNLFCLTKGRRSLANDNISILVGYANRKRKREEKEKRVDGHLYLLGDLKDSLANINCSPEENE